MRALVLYGVILPCSAASGLSVLVTSFDPPDPLGWLADLAVHWQWLYLAASLSGAVALAFVDRRRWVVGMLGVAVCAVSALFASPALPMGDTRAPTLKIATANLFYGNLDVRPLVEWIEAERPDLVFLQEVPPAAVSQLRGLARYPTLLIDAAPEPFALAVLVRHPLRAVETVVGTPGLAGQQLAYRLRMSWGGRDVAFAAVHLAAPITPFYRRQRDRLLLDTANWVARGDVPAAMIGDMNTTPWSASMRRAAAIGVRRATGLTPTWPAVVGSTVLIPIDHVLASPHWTVVARKRGPHIGSDHRPVVVSLALRPD